MLQERMELLTAARLVDEAAEILSEACDRIEIAGSIRRGRADVKDAEIVCIPTDGQLHTLLDQMVESGDIDKAIYTDGRTRWGTDYRGFIYRGLKVEVFMTNPESWGYQFWLRTGPGDANTYIMKALGNQKAPVRFLDGRGWYSPNWVYDDKKKAWTAERKYPLRLATEADLFGALGMPFVPPALRTVAKYRGILENRAHRWPDYGQYIIFNTSHPFQWDNGTARYETARDKHGDLYRTDVEIKHPDAEPGSSFTRWEDWYRDSFKRRLRVKTGTLSMSRAEHGRFRYENYLKALEGKTDYWSGVEREIISELLEELE